MLAIVQPTTETLPALQVFAVLCEHPAAWRLTLDARATGCRLCGRFPILN